jgi:hypothetical protein
VASGAAPLHDVVVTDIVPGRPDPALVVAASRAHAQEVMVASLLHDLNGLLNSVHLTLELLERALAQRAQGGSDAATDARTRRYLDTLKQEAARVTAWSRAAGAAIAPPGAGEARDLVAVVAEAQRLFHHHAAVANVRVESVTAGVEDVRVDDVAATRALLATLLCAAIAMASSDGLVRIELGADETRARLLVTVAPAVVTADAARALADPQHAPRSTLEADLWSVRAQAESLRGAASLRTDAKGVVLEVALPRG